MNELTPEVAELKRVFKRSKIGLDRLAAMTNLSKRTIWRVFNGTCSPKVSTFNKIAAPLGRRIVVGHLKKSA